MKTATKKQVDWRDWRFWIDYRNQAFWKGICIGAVAGLIMSAGRV